MEEAAAGARTLRIEDREDHLAVHLSRPEARNAISRAMVAELHAVCDELESRPRVLLLAGSEGVFAGGADIRELYGRGRDDALDGINSALFERISRLPMPVIAVLDGHVLGGGAELAYAADLRIATTRTRIGNPEVGLGILAAAGGTWRLRGLVGDGLAKEMLLAGRVLTAEEALDAGLLASVHEPAEIDAAAAALCRRITGQDALAVRVTKAVFRAPTGAHPLVDDLAQAILFESPAKRQRMRAFLDRSRR